MDFTQTKVFVVSAPSGAGKTTLVSALLERFDDFEFSVSATTRPPRHYEIEGIHYYFIDVETFRAKLAKDAFLEWEEVYEGRFYGTLRSEVDRIRKKGKAPIFDVDVEGGVNIKQQFGEQAVSIFIKPPRPEVLKERLVNRKSERTDEIEKRYQKAMRELTYEEKFDYVVVNDDLDTAIQDICKIVENELGLRSRESGISKS